MPRTSQTVSTQPGFLVDPTHVTRGPGRQIDWASVTAAYNNADGRKVLKAGTVLIVKAGTNGKCYPRALGTTETAMGILETDAIDDTGTYNRLAATQASTGFGVLTGADVYENLLPDATGGPPKTLLAAYKTELNAAGVGSFRWHVYEDVLL